MRKFLTDFLVGALLAGLVVLAVGLLLWGSNLAAVYLASCLGLGRAGESLIYASLVFWAVGTVAYVSVSATNGRMRTSLRVKVSREEQ